MTSRTALPATLSSPILQRSSEGVSFRTPASGQRNSPYMRGPSQSSMNFSVNQDPLSPNLRGPSPKMVQSEESTCSTAGGGSINMTMGAIVLVVFIYLAIYVVLYLSNFNMVTDLVNGERVLNTRKVLLWTFILGTALALVLYSAWRAMQ